MITLNNLDEIKSFIEKNEMALLYISSESCGVCKVIFPRLEVMLKFFPDMKPARVDIDEVQAAAGEYIAFTIPCILVFVQNKEVIREARYINLDGIKEKVDRYYRLIFSN
jgi:thiol-disulfide isomerase/thioredoxin